MTTLVEKIAVVQGNVKMNRKNVAAQVEALNTQLSSAHSTVEEMDALRALVEVALEHADVVAEAQLRLESNKAVIESESKEQV